MKKIASKSMTVEEVNEKATRFKTNIEKSRLIYLELFEADAHKIAGFTTWEAFCTERLGMTHSKTYHSDMLRVAKVERLVLPTVSGEQTKQTKQSSDASELTEIKPVKKLPIKTVLKKVAPLPESEQPAAYAREIVAVIDRKEERKSSPKSGATSRLDIAREQREEAALAAETLARQKEQRTPPATPAVSSYTIVRREPAPRQAGQEPALHSGQTVSYLNQICH